jgi:hypothetical protein
MNLIHFGRIDVTFNLGYCTKRRVVLAKLLRVFGVIKSKEVLSITTDILDVSDAYRIFVREPFRKPLLGRLRRIWDDNIKMDYKEIDSEDVS